MRYEYDIGRCFAVINIVTSSFVVCVEAYLPFLSVILVEDSGYEIL